VDLAREVPSVADPDGVGARAQLHPQLDALEVVLHRLAPHGGIGVGQAAELVGQLLRGLILEGVGVHGIEEEPAAVRERLQLGRVVRLVPRDVQRDSRGHPHELLHGLAILDLLEDAPRLPGTRETGEARPSRSHAPRGDRHSEGHGPLDQPFDVDPAARELASEVGVVLLQPGQPLPVLVCDQRLADGEGQGSS
jgi:hypothetical protein